MKKRNIFVYLVITLVLMTSCNEFYSDEQYEHYVSFKAPTNTVSRIRLKYREGEPSPYKLPLIVSGSTMNNRNIDVHIGIDNDTLAIYNYEHFYEREDLYYKQLPEEFYSIPNYDVRIPAGECQAMMDINFNFDNLDLSDNWVLPLIIKDDPSYGYQAHPRKNYNNALLWITPFNDYSGTYQTTNMNIYPQGSEQALVVDTREAFVVNANKIFFYAGATKENRPDRKKFKIYATFTPHEIFPNQGTVKLEAADESINFKDNSEEVSFEILEMMDESRPALMRRTLTIRGLNYTFEDPYEVEGEIIKYSVNGTMTMQRNINTMIDDEEYQIEW